MSIFVLKLIIVGIVPALVMGAGLYFSDRYQREPLLFLAQSFIYGMIAALLASLIEMAFVDLGWVFEGEEYARDLRNAPITTGEHLWRAFMGETLPDEAAKLLLLYLALRHNPFFRDRRDGLIYASMLGLGFAMMQNGLYLLHRMDEGGEFFLGHYMMNIPAQMVCTMLMGFFYSLFFYGPKKPIHFARFIYIPLVAHFIYGVIYHFIIRPLNSTLALIIFALLAYVLVLWMYFGLGRLLARLRLRSSRDPRQVAYVYDASKK